MYLDLLYASSTRSNRTLALEFVRSSHVFYPQYVVHITQDLGLEIGFLQGLI